MLPFTYLFQQRWFQLILLGIGGYQLYRGSSAAELFSKYGVQKFQKYRLTVTNEIPSGSNRSATWREMSSRIITFNLVWQGCELDLLSLRASQNISTAPDHGSSAFSLSFPAVQEMDGFSVKMSNSSSTSAESFILEGFENGTVGWITIGTPRFRRVREGIRLLHGEISSNFQGNLVFDYRAPWPLIFHESWVQIACGLFLVCISICGACGRIELSHSLVFQFLFFLGLNLLIVCVGYLTMSLSLEAFYPACLTLIVWSFLTLISCSQLHLRRGLIVQGLSILGCQIFNECVLFNDCEYLSESLSAVTLLTVICSAATVVLSRSLISRAMREVHTDRAEYGMAWQPVVRGSSQRRLLKELQKMVTVLQRGCPSHGARHLDRRQIPWSSTTVSETAAVQPAVLFSSEGMQRVFAALASPFDDFGLRFHGLDVSGQYKRGMPGTCDEFRPVRCPARLYSQALLVAECLHVRAAAWVSDAGARLHPQLDIAMMKAAKTARELQEVQSDYSGLGLEELIRSGLIKSPERAVVKALVCYEGDMSRVVDICRVRIIGRGLPQVIAALRAITGDCSVKIVRIKNTLRTRDISMWTAGFRVRVFFIPQLITKRHGLLHARNGATGKWRNYSELVLTPDSIFYFVTGACDKFVSM